MASERLTPIDLLPMLPPAEDQRTRIVILVAGDTKEGTVLNQYADGRVTIRFDHDGSERIFDLSTTRYR